MFQAKATASSVSVRTHPNAHSQTRSRRPSIGTVILAAAIAPSSPGLENEVAFSQPPTDNQEQLASNVDLSDVQPAGALIDDFVSDGRTITSLRWWGAAFPATVEPCNLINGGFETGDFTGWVAVDNGLPNSMPWTVGPAGTCDSWSIHCNAPLEGNVDAMNGFDGGAGLVYELYQDVALSAGASVTLVTNHRIQYDSFGAPSELPRTLDITVRNQSNEVLSSLYHEDVWLDGAPYTDLGWNEQIFDLSAFNGQTVRIHFNMAIPENNTGPAMIEFDDISLTCTAANNQFASSRPSAPPPDGWLVAFHVPRDDAAASNHPLGTYFCAAQSVSPTHATFTSCVEGDPTEYSVQLADCCLLDAIPDPRDDSIPAQSDGFHGTPCAYYDLSIAATVGRHYDWDPTVASCTGRWDEYEGEYADVWADGEYAYVPNWAASDGLPARIHVIDILNPAAPQLVTTFFFPSPNESASPEDVKAAGGLLFAALDAGGIDGAAILDIRDPATPALLATIRIPGFEDVHNLFYDNGYLYLADNQTPRIAIVDLTLFDPDVPPPSPITDALWIVQNVGGSAVRDITVANDRLYVAAGPSGVWLYDAANIAAQEPTYLGQSGGREALSVWPTADDAYLAAAEAGPEAGVRIYELQDQPGYVLFVLRDELLLSTEAFAPRNVRVVGHRLYASWNQAGLRVLDIDPLDGQLSPVALYDTTVLLDTGVTEGNWGLYPLPGGTHVLLSDTDRGLFTIDVTDLVGGCVAKSTGVAEAEPFWGWRSTAEEAGNRPPTVGVVALDPEDGWLYNGWTAVQPTCGSPNLSFELLTTETGGVTCGCATDDDCGDGDACTFDECISGGCVHTPRHYGDVDGNGYLTLFDLFALLDGIAGDFSDSAFVNQDIEPCAGNGFITLFDLFAVLDAIGGEDPCNC
jgi:hypothetical protein